MANGVCSQRPHNISSPDTVPTIRPIKSCKCFASVQTISIDWYHASRLNFFEDGKDIAVSALGVPLQRTVLTLLMYVISCLKTPVYFSFIFDFFIP